MYIERYLKDNFNLIRDEYLLLKPELFTKWPELDIYIGDWSVFGLFKFKDRLTENCKLMPKTTQILEKIKGLNTAGLSLLRPNTHILPHKGYGNNVLRYHLCLQAPSNKEDSCLIYNLPSGEVYKHFWVEGEVMFFDDTQWHYGFNLQSDKDRVNLLIDIDK